MDLKPKSDRYNKAFARSREYKRLVAFYLHRYHLKHLNRPEVRPYLGSPLEEIYAIAVKANLPIAEWKNEKRILSRLRTVIERKTGEIPVDSMRFPRELDADGFLTSLAKSKFCEPTC